MRYLFKGSLMVLVVFMLAACGNALNDEAQANQDVAVDALITQASADDGFSEMLEGSWICAETTARDQTMVSCMFFFTYETVSGETHYATVSAGGTGESRDASATLYDNAASFTADKATALDNLRSFSDNVLEGELSTADLNAIND